MASGWRGPRRLTFRSSHAQALSAVSVILREPRQWCHLIGKFYIMSCIPMSLILKGNTDLSKHLGPSSLIWHGSTLWHGGLGVSEVNSNSWSSVKMTELQRAPWNQCPLVGCLLAVEHQWTRRTRWWRPCWAGDGSTALTVRVRWSEGRNIRGTGGRQEGWGFTEKWFR